MLAVPVNIMDKGVVMLGFTVSAWHPLVFHKVRKNVVSFIRQESVYLK